MALKVGVIEDGRMYYPTPYITALKKIEDVDVCAICFMASEEKMRISNYGTGRDHFINDLGLKPYEDIELMIKEQELDAAILFGEYSKKADHIEVAARGGVSIFTTKPPATSKDQMRRIIEAGKRNNVAISIPEHSVYYPLAQKAKDLVAAGEIGNIVTCRALHQHGKMDENESDPAHWYRTVENGGPEVSLGWYTAGALLRMVDSEAERVYAEYGNFMTGWSPHMDNGTATVRFANGCIGSMSIHFSTGWPYPAAEIAAVGTEGSLTFRVTDAMVSELTLYKPSGVTVETAEHCDSIDSEMDAWVKSCGDGRVRGNLTPEQAADVLNLCLSWKESADTGKVVQMSPLR